MLPRSILVPTDFSATAEHALDQAVELAAKLDGRITVLHVIGSQLMGAEFGLTVTSTMVDGLIADAYAAVARLVERRAKLSAFAPAVVRVGEPRSTILATAKDVAADWIIMGTHGRHGLSRIVLGSVAESVTRSASCPVLLVREAIA